MCHRSRLLQLLRLLLLILPVVPLLVLLFEGHVHFPVVDRLRFDRVYIECMCDNIITNVFLFFKTRVCLLPRTHPPRSLRPREGYPVPSTTNGAVQLPTALVSRK